MLHFSGNYTSSYDQQQHGYDYNSQQAPTTLYETTTSAHTTNPQPPQQQPHEEEGAHKPTQVTEDTTGSSNTVALLKSLVESNRKQEQYLETIIDQLAQLNRIMLRQLQPQPHTDPHSTRNEPPPRQKQQQLYTPAMAEDKPLLQTPEQERQWKASAMLLEQKQAEQTQAIMAKLEEQKRVKAELDKKSRQLMNNLLTSNTSDDTQQQQQPNHAPTSPKQIITSKEDRHSAKGLFGDDDY